MGVIVDKLMIFLGCCFLLAGKSTGISDVIAVLLTVIFTALTLYLDRRTFTWITVGIYLAACLLVPSMTLFLPLIFYDCFRGKMWLHIAAGIVISALSLNSSLLIMQGFFIFLGIASFLLSWRCERVEELRTSYRHLRDQSTELNIVLEEKNQELQQQQDKEIHLATLEERNRIAREIHDNVGHMLSRSILQTAALQMMNKDDTLKESIDSLKDTLTGAMDSIRKSVHNLHDEAIDLYQGVSKIIDSFPGYRIHLDYDISDDAEKEIKYCFMATIKEAFSNVSKHSDASEISITIREHPALYQLLIEDNGTGKVAQDSGGMGLESMKERVDSLNGTIRFSSKAGFRIFISIPKK